MAKIVSKAQRIITGVTNPVPAYSRVIALELHVAGGVGNSDFCYTPALGNRLWLKNLDVWVYSGTADQFIGGFFYLCFGANEPQSAEEIAVQWTKIIPLSCGAKLGFRWFECEAFHRHFTMARFFDVAGLRFGVLLENGFAQSWEATVAFEISEG